MNVDEYLERIGYLKSATSRYQELCDLIYCHVMTVPFENIDVQNNVHISLDVDKLYDKIVNNKRGGYCYELNSLFFELLKALEFDVNIIMGRVANGNNIGPEYDHLALIVTIDSKKYLADIGFGDFALKPLLIDDAIVQSDGRDDYKIDNYGMIDGRHYKKVEKRNKANGTYVVSYYFSTEPVLIADFNTMNEYQQSHPDSHFVRNFICSMPTPNGRFSILNYKAVFTYKNKKRTRVLDTKRREKMMSKYFGFSLSGKLVKDSHFDIGL